MKKITIFGKEIIDANAIAQIERCYSDDDIAVLTADAHSGYSMPIGGCVAYKNQVSPSGVGYDIGCGNAAARTTIKASDVDVPLIMNEIFKNISFGVGRPNNDKVDHGIFDLINNADFEPQRKLLQLAKAQLGTVGSGNHFVNLHEDEEGYLWIAVHFGSRGFGHKTASGFIAMANGLDFEAKGKEGHMDSPPILFDADSYTGQAYLSAMNIAGQYAFAGRETVINKVLSILGTNEITKMVHNNHNFCWIEEHFGEKYYVVRKGCTPAFPNQQGFIGANMRDTSVIVEGVDSELSRNGLYSTVHGAGRILSRTQAAGKKKWMKDESGKKRPVIIGKGLVDWDSVREEMKSSKVELRGAGADEAPECYKSLEEVLKYQGGTIKIVHKLRPIGVAMAGGDEFDPYKD